MQLLAKTVVGFIVVILGLGVGARWIFAPETVAAEFGITLDGALALNQVRGDIGGVFLGQGVLCAVGLLRREPRFLQAVAIAIGCVIFGRLVGVVLDGPTRDAVVAMIAETVFLGVLLFAAKGFGDAAAAAGAAEGG